MNPRILLLEDSTSDVELCQREFARAGFQAQFRCVQTRIAFEDAFAEFKPDLVLSDFNVPGFDGMAALAIALANQPETPFIFVSGTIGEDRAVEAMRSGATDYVLKDRLDRLVPVVIRAWKETKQRRAQQAVEKELQLTRLRLEAIIASLDDVVWSEAVSPSQTLYVSTATRDVYDRPCAEFYAAPELWMQIIHSSDRDTVKQLWQAAVRGALFQAEYRIVRPDGEVRWIHNRGTPVTNAEGVVVRIDGLARDVTERHAQQQKINRLSRIRAVLTSVNAAIVRIRDREALFEEACRIAVEDGKFTMAWIGIAESDAQKVKPVAWYGCDEGYLAEVGHELSIRIADPGAAARVLRQRSAVIVNDIAVDPRFVFKEAALDRGYRSCALLPLFVGDQPAAVLTMFASERDVFDQQELDLLNDLAGDISFAMAYIDQEQKLNFMAYHDSLTGLCNRTMLVDRLSQAMAHAQRRGGPVAAVFIDLDHFKPINDNLGHGAGDYLLKTTAQRLIACLRDEDTVARTGGDEFVVILAHQANPTAVSIVVQRILHAVSQPSFYEGQEMRVTCSVGVSLFPKDGSETAVLLKHADAAMYRAKELGRNRFHFYEGNSTRGTGISSAAIGIAAGAGSVDQIIGTN
jgi:diguanylate cyclase (GGDEF)-like protein